MRSQVFSYQFCVPHYLMAAFIVWLTSGVTEAQLIYDQNFDQYNVDRLYTEDDLDADWNTPVWEDGVREGRIALTTGPEAHGNGASLAVLYPKDGYGTKLGGGQWILDLPGSYTMVKLRYRVKFGSGFDFVRGGKLPGLAGGTAPTGNTPADGYNGWTARMMWRTDYQGLPGVVRQPRANLVQYVKHPTSGFDQTGVDEDNYYWMNRNKRLKIKSGRWYIVTQVVLLNTVGQANGRVMAWIDGKRVLDKRGIEFRYTNALGIDKLYFSTFFGGGSSNWAPSKDEVAYFDDFTITVRIP